ncbi:MAG TPA: fused MFS/spermidine synthase [Candidatus Competibacter sp.]|nr:fused MFS/spermidine synthase [Candidatus Competibacter sp.]HRX62598.1 fused MFS/spermidine synthase [Candidatus Competibacter sp.]
MLHRLFVFLIAGWSGFLVMAIELLSGRILAPNFGNSIYVWGGIITVFMLALAVGYLLGGRWSLHDPSLRRLALLLLAGAIAVIPVIFLADPLLDWLFDQIQDPRYGSLASVTLLFFIPTTIAGMVSPYAVRLLVRESAQSGHFAGLLYFVSTFGSAAGTILTSFYFVLYFEIDQILAGLVGVSLLLGLLALFFGNSGNASKE